MSEFKKTGLLIDVFDTITVSDTFKKREYIVKTEDQYPQLIKFQLTQNNCDKIDNFKIGDRITSHFNIRGNKWTNKEGKDSYFISLQAWRLEGDAASPSSHQEEQPKEDKVDFNESLPF